MTSCFRRNGEVLRRISSLDPKYLVDKYSQVDETEIQPIDEGGDIINGKYKPNYVYKPEFPPKLAGISLHKEELKTNELKAKIMTTTDDELKTLWERGAGLCTSWCILISSFIYPALTRAALRVQTKWETGFIHGYQSKVCISRRRIPFSSNKARISYRIAPV
jgi:hypothetical protein